MSEDNKKKSLEELFNIQSTKPKQDLVPVEQGEVIESDIDEVQNSVDEDFERARANITKITDLTDTALDDLAYIAKDSEQPRSYDALSKLVAAATAANKALVEIHKNRKEGKDEDGEGGPRVVNQNVFMTTADFQRELEARRERIESGEEDDEEDSD
jgi:hypothetical protein